MMGVFCFFLYIRPVIMGTKTPILAYVPPPYSRQESEFFDGVAACFTPCCVSLRTNICVFRFVVTLYCDVAVRFFVYILDFNVSIFF